MTQESFAEILNQTFEKSKEILLSKSKEYSGGGDKLHNFKVAAQLAQCTNEKALAGMMIKHTVSVYDMINEWEGGTKHTIEKWDEKIFDSINYLILLRALLFEHFIKCSRTTSNGTASKE